MALSVYSFPKFKIKVWYLSELLMLNTFHRETKWGWNLGSILFCGISGKLWGFLLVEQQWKYFNSCGKAGLHKNDDRLVLSKRGVSRWWCSTRDRRKFSLVKILQLSQGNKPLVRSIYLSFAAWNTQQKPEICIQNDAIASIRVLILDNQILQVINSMHYTCLRLIGYERQTTSSPQRTRNTD